VFLVVYGQGSKALFVTLLTELCFGGLNFLPERLSREEDDLSAFYFLSLRTAFVVTF